MMAPRRSARGVSPAEWLSALDACPQGRANPYVDLLRGSLEDHGMNFRFVAGLVQREIEDSYRSRVTATCNPIGRHLLDVEGQADGHEA